MINFSQLIDAESLEKRFKKTLSRSQVTGVDGILPRRFEENLELEIATIQRKINKLTYKFSPFREKLILKKKNAYPRVTFIPTVRDRLVMSALKDHLSEIFQEELSICQRSLQSLVKEVVNAYQGNQYNYFLKFDIKDFYQSINHDALIRLLKEKVHDRRVMSLLRKILNKTGKKGVPQGAGVSSLLANLYFLEIDNHFKSDEGICYFRYVDDILIFCKEKDSKRIEAELKKIVGTLNLELHSLENSDKSSQGKLLEKPFQYLGYTFDKEKISVRNRTLNKLYNQFIKLIRDYQDHLIEEEVFYEKLNQKITGKYYNGRLYGWLFYFRYINDMTLLYQLDNFIEKKLQQFGVKYEPSKIKRFVRAYYEVNHHRKELLTKKSYIPTNGGILSVPANLFIGLFSEQEKQEVEELKVNYIDL